MPDSVQDSAKPVPKTLPVGKLDVLGIHIDCIDMDQLLDQISAWVEHSRLARSQGHSDPAGCRQICTVNPEFVMDARRNSAFAAVLDRADLRVPDGIGIVLAARLRGAPAPMRITGSDGIYYICERAAEEGWRVFFLGAAPGVAERTGETLRRSYPELIVAGAYSGSPQENDWPQIYEQLKGTQPDILLVAFGHPLQDFWIDAYRQQLPAAVAIGVGGAFDFVAGVTVRAPVWMRRLGLEWLHRLLRQPWRWRRMSKLPLFAALALRQALVGRRKR